MTPVEAIGRFVVLDRIGVGAHAVVYRAEDPVLEQLVALKVLSAQVAFDLDLRARFIKEARLMRRLESPRTVKVHDVAQLPDGRPYLVLELAERGTLEDRFDLVVARQQRLTVLDVRDVVAALGSALAAIHDRGVVHRDVKPSNILLRPAPDGQPPDGHQGGLLLHDDDYLVLTDFGLAKALDATRLVTAAAGTPAYMAPEQAVIGIPVDGRADVFAASAVVQELLDRTIGPHDPRITAALARGMERDRERRQPDARTWTREVLAAVDASLAPATVTVPSAAVPPPPRAAASESARPAAPAVRPATAYRPTPAARRRGGFPGGPVLLAVLVAALVVVTLAVVAALDYAGGS